MPVAEQGASSRIASNCRSGFHVSASAATRSALEVRPLRDSRAVVQGDFSRLDRRHAVAGGGELHRLAAGRGAEVEHVRGVAGDQPRGQRGGEVLHPPAALAEARQLGDRELLVQPDMARRERDAAVARGIGLRLGIVGEAEVERRAVAI